MRKTAQYATVCDIINIEDLLAEIEADEQSSSNALFDDGAVIGRNPDFAPLTGRRVNYRHAA